jgi:ribonuclease HI
VLLAEAKEIPVDIRFTYLTKNYLNQVFGSTDHPYIHILDKLLEIRDNPVRISKGMEPYIITCYGEMERVCHYFFNSTKPTTCNTYYGSLIYKAKLSFNEGEEIKKLDKNEVFKRIFKDKLEETICYFTDGSKNNNHPFVGFAYLQCNDKIICRERTCKFASIFSGETMAILSVLDDIYQRKEREFNIFSDAKSVLISLNSLSNLKNKSPLILEAKEKLCEIEQLGREVKFWWIPDHTGIEMNEIVDGVAKESVREGKDSPRSIPTSDLKAWWKAEMKKDFRVLMSQGGKKGKKFFKIFISRELTHGSTVSN